MTASFPQTPIVPDPIPHEDLFRIDGPDAAGQITARFLAFNTGIMLQAYGNERTVRAAFSIARDACRTYERLFSRTLPHSDIARLNAAGGTRVSISPLTADVLSRALHYCAESAGAFDVTVGPLVRLWDFGAGIAPDSASLARAAKHVGWRGVEVSEGESSWARLRDPHAAVDLGGIAKGWIADRLLEEMRAQGLVHFLVNLGGNVAVGGAKPDGRPWRVGIRDPRNPQRYPRIVELVCGSAVTSGTYERYFEKNGRLYHHVLDPRSGLPAKTDAASVTVVADRSIDAEGFSTTLLALGVERGLDLARRHSELRQVVYVRPDGECILLRP